MATEFLQSPAKPSYDPITLGTIQPKILPYKNNLARNEPWAATTLTFTCEKTSGKPMHICIAGFNITTNPFSVNIKTYFMEDQITVANDAITLVAGAYSFGLYTSIVSTADKVVIEVKRTGTTAGTFTLNTLEY